MTTAPVKFSELRDGFDLVSLGGGTGAESYVGLDTGKVYLNTDYEDPDDPLPDDLGESPRYIPVASRSELRLGRGLALDFIEDAAPADSGRVAGFFQRKGAYARFKDLLDERGLLERWYAFEEAATNRALREWAAENDIPIIEA